MPRSIFKISIFAWVTGLSVLTGAGAGPLLAASARLVAPQTRSSGFIGISSINVNDSLVVVVQDTISTTFFVTPFFDSGFPQQIIFELQGSCYQGDAPFQQAGLGATVTINGVGSANLGCANSLGSTTYASLSVPNGVQLEVTTSLSALAKFDQANGLLGIVIASPSTLVLSDAAYLQSLPEPSSLALTIGGLCLVVSRLRKTRRSHFCD